MSKFLSILVAAVFAVAVGTAFAADPPKDPAATKAAPAKLDKPADVSAEAWAKMSDADKTKAVEKAKKMAAS